MKSRKIRCEYENNLTKNQTILFKRQKSEIQNTWWIWKQNHKKSFNILVVSNFTLINGWKIFRIDFQISRTKCRKFQELIFLNKEITMVKKGRERKEQFGVKPINRGQWVIEDFLKKTITGYWSKKASNVGLIWETKRKKINYIRIQFIF